jgi:hypothetical protein
MIQSAPQMRLQDSAECIDLSFSHRLFSVRVGGLARLDCEGCCERCGRCAIWEKPCECAFATEGGTLGRCSRECQSAHAGSFMLGLRHCKSSQGTGAARLEAASRPSSSVTTKAKPHHLQGTRLCALASRPYSALLNACMPHSSQIIKTLQIHTQPRSDLALYLHTQLYSPARSGLTHKHPCPAQIHLPPQMYSLYTCLPFLHRPSHHTIAHEIETLT